MKKSTTETSRTPILDAYRVVYIDVPEHPQLLKIVLTSEKMVCINLAAAPEANVVRWHPLS